MSRYVVPSSGVAVAGGPVVPPDQFRDRLVKYVPAEVLTIYTAAVGGVVAANTAPPTAQWIAVGLMAFSVVITLVYFWRTAPAGSVRRAHMIASPIVFLTLGYPIAAPLLGPWYLGVVAVLAQAVVAGVAWAIAP
jgi:hypothetical protein